MNLQLRALGPLEVILSGQPIKIGGLRQRKLLAILVLHANRVVSVDQLIDELWDDPPQSARQQIHNAIGSLRRTLAGTAEHLKITSTEIGYRLDVADELVDLNNFLDRTRAADAAWSRQDWQEAIRLLDSALSVWRGQPLSGLSSTMIDTAVAGLIESRLSTLDRLISLRLKAGESASLISELTRLVAVNPLRESLRGSLMQALYFSDRKADALSIYEEGRKVLADELGIDPGTALRELHLSILNDSLDPPTVSAGNDAGGTEFARETDNGPARSYLPHDTSDFSGRSAELADLVGEARRAQPTTLVISAIDGMGGVGKTTLAIHLAHQVADTYPDGQYFVDLHGFSTGIEPINAEQALEQLLRDNGVPPELVPSGVEARSALWRSQLAGTRALVLLDNAVDAAQIRPLLPGSAGVLVVVTSRRKLSALDGAVPLSLDVLSPQEAIDMFTKVIGKRKAGRDPEAVAEAVRLCGYLPLAIRVAAARLRDRSSWTVGDLVDRIRDQAYRARFLQVEDRNVMAVLKLSYRYLPPLQRKVFRLLSLHPGTEYDAYATAALAGMTLEEAEACLDGLYEANLLKQNSPEWFHFHDLVRDCAFQVLNETINEDQRRIALQRLFDYYTSATEEWCSSLSSSPPLRKPDVDVVPEQVRPTSSSAEATALLGLEFPNLSAVVRFAADHGWHRHAWQLVCVMAPYLRLQNYGGRSHDLFASAAQAAAKDGDVDGEAICLQGLATVCRERGQKDEAIRHLKRAHELAKKTDDRSRESSLLIDLGIMRLDADMLEESERDFRQAYALSRNGNNNSLRASVANNLAVISRDLGKFDESFDYLTQALAAISPDAVRHRLLITWNIGMLRVAQRDHESAVREFDEILSDSTAIGFEFGEAMARLGLCAARRSLGDLEDSLDHGRRALTLTRQFKMHRVECETLNNLGETVFATKDLDHAEKVFEQAKERAIHYSIARYQARALEGFAHIAFARGELTDASQCWQQAVELYPSGMIDATYAQRHLASMDDDSATCFRCDIG